MTLRLALARQTELAAGIALCAIQVEEGKPPPEWIELFPADAVIIARDKRVFKKSNPEAIVAAFLNDRKDAPIDYEHATELKGPMGEPAPAVGWIAELQVREDRSIWGRVSWNEAGAASLTKREYRYISPAFRYDLETLEIMQLTSAGLTNNPAFYLTELARHQEGEEEMDKELLKMLGLAETATAEDARKALKALQDKQAGDLSASQAQVTQAQSDLASARQATASALKDMVPRSDLSSAIARAETAEAKVKDSEAKALASKVDGAIKQALKDGKIAPAAEAYFRGLCTDEKGLASFQEFASQSAAIVPDKKEGGAGQGQPELDLNADATEAELAIASAAGISAEDFKKQKKALARELQA